MKLLMLAPQPFFQERGTPIAVDLLLQELSRRAESIDLLVYHEGADRAYPNVRLHRIPKPPGARRVGPGLSGKKLLCDVAFTQYALKLASSNAYNLVYAVEEGAFVAWLIKRKHGVPYVYDMDSGLAQQVMDRLPWLKPLHPALERPEQAVIRDASLVVPVCDALAEIARGAGQPNVLVLRDVSLLQPADGAAEGPHDLGPLTEPVVMYIGNLEPYQGMDLLLRSVALARRALACQLVVIGGHERDIRRYQSLARDLGVGGSVRLLGPRPVARLARYLACADVLVSPRISGRNTPMKIYSYMESGRAILATDLPTHTQALTGDTALLCAPAPGPFSEGLVRLLRDPALRQRLGSRAHAVARSRHSRETFRRVVSQLWDRMALAAGGPASAQDDTMLVTTHPEVSA